MATSSLLSRVLASVFFRGANLKAARYARNSKSLFTLIQEVLSKSGGLSGNNVQGVRDQLGLLTRMLKAYANGDYRGIPWKTLISVIAVLIYFVSPIDFIPDFLPFVGFADDIALLLWLFGSIQKDLDKFRQWENQQAGMSETPNRRKTINIG